MAKTAPSREPSRALAISVSFSWLSAASICGGRESGRGRSIKNVLWFRRGLAGKARDFNWHNVFGFWASVPLFVVVLSAVVISYPWASNLVYRVVGETPPAPRAAQPTPSGAAVQREGMGRGDSAMLMSGLDGLWARAVQQVPQWKIITMQVPASVESPVTFTIDQGDGGQPQKRAQLSLDRSTGEIVQWEPFSSYSSGRQLRSILRFAHTGEVVGVPVRQLRASHHWRRQPLSGRVLRSHGDARGHGREDETQTPVADPIAYINEARSETEISANQGDRLQFESATASSTAFPKDISEDLFESMNCSERGNHALTFALCDAPAEPSTRK